MGDQHIESQSIDNVIDKANNDVTMINVSHELTPTSHQLFDNGQSSAVHANPIDGYDAGVAVFMVCILMLLLRLICSCFNKQTSATRASTPAESKHVHFCRADNEQIPKNEAFASEQTRLLALISESQTRLNELFEQEVEDNEEMMDIESQLQPITEHDTVNTPK